MNEPNQGRRRLPQPPPVQTPEQRALVRKLDGMPSAPEAKDRINEEARERSASGKPRERLPEEIGRRTLKVSWGEENYHPVAYNGFKVGGLELMVDVAPNQTIEEAYELAYGRLEKIVERQFESKLEGFINRLRKAGQAVKVSASSSKS